MAVEIHLTNGSVRVRTALGQTQVQPLDQAVDVSSIDQADLLLTMLGVDGAVGAGFQVSVLTGMSDTTDEGWVSAGAFTASNSGTFVEKRNFPGLLKYVRWQVQGLTGGTSVTFSVSGMGRSN